MRATNVMILAALAAVVGRWANNRKAVPDAKGLIEFGFALVVVAALDSGRTQPVAKGFAWLFFAAVMLGGNSPLTGLAKGSGAPAAGPVGPPVAPGPFPRRG